VVEGCTGPVQLLHEGWLQAAGGFYGLLKVASEARG
jgi:hypothetical protein